MKGLEKWQTSYKKEGVAEDQDRSCSERTCNIEEKRLFKTISFRFIGVYEKESARFISENRL